MDNDEKMQQQEATKYELCNNTIFMWDAGPEWLGMNQEELKSLYAEVGGALDIKPDEAKKIQAYFGDHIVVNFEHHSDINSACCITDYDDDDNVEKCRLIFNRSLEVAAYRIYNDKISQESQTEGLKCVFEDPKEALIWLMAEELGHAKIFIRAGTKERESKWQENYARILANKEISSNDKYRESLQEVTVSRNAVRILKKFFPERAEYYQELYDSALEQNVQIIPDIRKVAGQTYISTGFNPAVLVSEKS